MAIPYFKTNYSKTDIRVDRQIKRNQILILDRSILHGMFINSAGSIIPCQKDRMLIEYIPTNLEQFFIF